MNLAATSAAAPLPPTTSSEVRYCPLARLRSATARHIRALLVGGRTIVRDGRVLGIDLPSIRQELLARMRRDIEADGALAEALAALEPCLARHYLNLDEAPCC